MPAYLNESRRYLKLDGKPALYAALGGKNYYFADIRVASSSSSLTLAPSASTNVTISGGIGPYKVSSTGSTASANSSGVRQGDGTLRQSWNVRAGTSLGTNYLTVTDMTTAKSVKISVSVTKPHLQVSPSSVSMSSDDTVTLTITPTLEGMSYTSYSGIVQLTSDAVAVVQTDSNKVRLTMHGHFSAKVTFSVPGYESATLQIN
jgi:hypothetical protein